MFCFFICIKRGNVMTLQITTIVFLIVLLIVFQFVKGTSRRWVLLLGSVVFICFEGGLLGILAVTFVTLLTYVAGRFLLSGEKKRSTAFAVIAVLVLILFGWKFIAFLAPRAELYGLSGSMSIPLPIGLSFYTFQAISYIADIYEGRVVPERDIVNFSLYMLFFPKWMSGPIERAGTFIEQLGFQGNIRAYSFHRITHAAAYIVWGLVLKLLIADKVAIAVDTAFGDITVLGPVTLFVVSILYTLQIYCDFAGYTDIAIGISKLFGIDLSKNFKTPYMAENIKDFWRRWHMSLSSFLRDYVYIPLGGNQKGTFKKYFNTVVVFFVCGLWHGIGLSFLAWGLLHGAYCVVTDLISKTRLKFLTNGTLGRIITFLLVNFAWIFFRAASLSQAISFIKCMIPSLNANVITAGLVNYGGEVLGLGARDWWIIAASVVVLIIMDHVAYKRDVFTPMVMIQGLSDNRRAVVLALVLSIVLIFGEYGSGAQVREFVYMNF